MFICAIVPVLCPLQHLCHAWKTKGLQGLHGYTLLKFCGSICKRQWGSWLCHPNPGVMQKRSKKSKTFKMVINELQRLIFFGWKLQFGWFLELPTKAIFWYVLSSMSFFYTFAYFKSTKKSAFSSRSFSCNFRINQIR